MSGGGVVPVLLFIARICVYLMVALSVAKVAAYYWLWRCRRRLREWREAVAREETMSDG
jgi:hypothetical protein